MHSDTQHDVFQPRQLFHTARRRNLRRCCRPIVLCFLPHCDTELRRTVESDFRQPPRENEAGAFVSRGVKKSCTENESHLATLAASVVELTMVQAFVWNWWGFRKDRLMENSDQPPTSARAARYTKAPRKKREEAIMNFDSHEDIRPLRFPSREFGLSRRRFVSLFATDSGYCLEIGSNTVVANKNGWRRVGGRGE